MNSKILKRDFLKRALLGLGAALLAVRTPAALARVTGGAPALTAAARHQAQLARWVARWRSIRQPEGVRSKPAA